MVDVAPPLVADPFEFLLNFNVTRFVKYPAAASLKRPLPL